MNASYISTSTVSWLDYADADKRRMQQVIDLFRDKDTRDELGLGGVRDALSDLLFPGSSTIQTRARYFLFVPWLCRGIASGKGYQHLSLTGRLRSMESGLINALEKGGEGVNAGLIGRRARDRTKRMPSSIYWHGLYVWGIRSWEGSIEAILREPPLTRSSLRRMSDDGDFVAPDAGPWHSDLPDPPTGFYLLNELNFELSRSEAEFLRDSVLSAVPSSLLAWLLTHSTASDAPYVWQHPDLSRFTQKHCTQVGLAERFSTVMYGASLLYGRMLAAKRPDGEMFDNIDQSWQGWFESARAAAAEWDDPALWQTVDAVNPRVAPGARAFIQRWVQAVQDARSLRELDAQSVRQLIVERESALKRQLARLSDTKAYDVWLRSVNDTWHPAQLDFRWRTVQRLASDILTPLHNAHAQA